MAITIIQPQTEGQALTTETARRADPYLAAFNLRAAYQSVMDHIAQLPSDKTAEQNTRDAYTRDLEQFIAWLAPRLVLPDTGQIKSYIAHLVGAGMASSSIARKLAPIRLYCNALGGQMLDETNLKRLMIENPAISIWGYLERRESIRDATKVKAPRAAETTDESPLEATGKRLSPDEVNTILASINRATLAGKRDYALLMLGFYSGLRIAEISRLTMDSIAQQSPDTYVIKVKGKRSKWRRVAIPAVAYRAIETYVESYNAICQHQLDGSLSHYRIAPDAPIWKGLGKWDKPTSGHMSRVSLARIITRVTAAAGLPIAPHDMRRTWAFIARETELDYDLMQAQLGHASLDMTAKYVGEKRDFDRQNLALAGVQFGA